MWSVRVHCFSILITAQGNSLGLLKEVKRERERERRQSLCAFQWQFLSLLPLSSSQYRWLLFIISHYQLVYWLGIVLVVSSCIVSLTQLSFTLSLSSCVVSLLPSFILPSKSPRMIQRTSCMCGRFVTDPRRSQCKWMNSFFFFEYHNEEWACINVGADAKH